MTGRRAFYIFLTLLLLGLSQAGCARLFGWDIHAPGILSQNFNHQVQPVPSRMALYFPPELLNFQSKDRGGKTADPQTYHVGEALGPMMIEGFQNGFEEFIFMEVEPTTQILKQYSIPYLVVVQIKRFDNNVTWRGQGITLITEAVVLDSDLNIVGRFEARGLSDAEKVFAKKGGPQVNLNAAIENNVLAIVKYLQDSIRTNAWKGASSST